MGRLRPFEYSPSELFSDPGQAGSEGAPQMAFPHDAQTIQSFSIFTFQIIGRRSTQASPDPTSDRCRLRMAMSVFTTQPLSSMLRVCEPTGSQASCTPPPAWHGGCFDGEARRTGLTSFHPHQNHQSHRDMARSDHAGQRKFIVQTCFRTTHPNCGRYRGDLHGPARLRRPNQSASWLENCHHAGRSLAWSHAGPAGGI